MTAQSFCCSSGQSCLFSAKPGRTLSGSSAPPNSWKLRERSLRKGASTPPQLKILPRRRAWQRARSIFITGPNRRFTGRRSSTASRNCLMKSGRRWPRMRRLKTRSGPSSPSRSDTLKGTGTSSGFIFLKLAAALSIQCNYPGVLKQCTSSKRDCSKPPFSRASDGSKSARSVRTRRPWPSATWSGALSCSGFLDGLKRTLNPTSASSSISFGEESQRENQRMDENSSARLPPVRMGSRGRADESGCGRQLGSKHRNGTEHEHLAEHSSARCNRKPVHGQRSAGSRAAESAASFFERRHQPCSEVQPGNPSERARDGTGARRQDLCTQQAAAPDFCGDLGIGRADQPEGSGLPIIPGSAAHHRAVRRLDVRGYLDQPVLDFEDLQREKAESHNIKAAQYSYQDARDLVVLVAANLYLEAVAGSSRVDAARAQVKTSQAVYDRAVDMHKAGLVPGIDVVRSQVELQAEQQRLI